MIKFEKFILCQEAGDNSGNTPTNPPTPSPTPDSGSGDNSGSGSGNNNGGNGNGTTPPDPFIGLGPFSTDEENEKE